jgi:hypothetical protein
MWRREPEKILLPNESSSNAAKSSVVNQSKLKLKSPKREYDATDKALYRARIGRENAERLRGAAMLAEDAEAQAVADIISETAKLENIFIAEGARNPKTGELFTAYGSLTLSGSRLCPAYLSAASRRARKRAVEALSRVRPQSGEHLRFLTVTMPTLRASFRQSLEVLDAALVLLKKRKWFRDNVRGAVIGNEFTIAVSDGFHVHAHMMAWSRWINWVEFGEQWTQCLEAAMPDGVEMNIETEHGRAIVDVRFVTAKQRGKGTISFKDAVQETCKYMVKGADFDKIPLAELCEVEKTLYRRRMIETFGECNFPRKQTARKKGTYLDTACTSDGRASQAETRSATKNLPFDELKERERPLRVRGAEMIRDGRRQEWLTKLANEMRARREWRKNQLTYLFPFAKFRTLAGEMWDGDAVRSGTVLPSRINCLK